MRPVEKIHMNFTIILSSQQSIWSAQTPKNGALSNPATLQTFTLPSLVMSKHNIFYSISSTS